MRSWIFTLPKIKPHETSLVKKLFAIQFLLGISTAFLFTCSLTSFIPIYHINALRYVYLLSAVLLIIFNRIYSYYDEHLTSSKLLEIVVLFSVISVLAFWLCLTIFPYKWITLLLAGWYLIVYMLINYAFWGMASMLFNVRESRRLFSLVGAGDIPAKMLGYVCASLLVPFIGVNNLLWVSIITGAFAWLLVKKFRRDTLPAVEDPNLTHATHALYHGDDRKNFIIRYFGNRIVFFIALFSLLSYIIFALMDFTFLAGVKYKFSEGTKIASFIGLFFASGRLIGMFFKMLFSSRLIAAIGLANSLLVTPVILLIIITLLLVTPHSLDSTFYVFGGMVLLSEMLRSTLQEPVFFILFQPLKPHDRLRGHLIAKGHTMPIALLIVGLFLFFYLRTHFGNISIIQVTELLILFLVLWCLSVVFIKKEYLTTLVGLLKKDYFTGSTLFLDDAGITKLLIKKTQDSNPQQVIHALSLLEKSGYSERHKLLLDFLQTGNTQIKVYVLLRVIANKMTSALPIIQQQLIESNDNALTGLLYQALFYLSPATGQELIDRINMLSADHKKAAMIGLLLRKDEQTDKLAFDEINNLTDSENSGDRLLGLGIIKEACSANFNDVLKKLLTDRDDEVCKKAIETAGTVKRLDLFEQVLQVTKKRQLYPSFKVALFYYGDDAFANEYYETTTLNDQLLSAIIITAGKVNGENSTNLLLGYLKEKPAHTDVIVNALWNKKVPIGSHHHHLLEHCVAGRIHNSNIKLAYYTRFMHEESFYLLKDAIQKEIRADLHTLLKLYSFLYDTEKVNRIIELITLGNREKLFNAIETLQLLLPAKYFAPTNNLIEWLQDVNQNEIIGLIENKSVEKILEEIFSKNPAGFHSWTRSVACYTLLKIKKDKKVLHSLEKSSFSEDDHLFKETKNYVLSILNN
ncbi:MAG: hypothetical protein ABIR81_09800 [Ginsengibacter sp.]